VVPSEPPAAFDPADWKVLLAGATDCADWVVPADPPAGIDPADWNVLLAGATDCTDCVVPADPPAGIDPADWNVLLAGATDSGDCADAEPAAFEPADWKVLVAGATDWADCTEAEPPAASEPADWKVPLAAAWLSPAEVALAWSPSSEPDAVLPGENWMISEAAARLLSAAESAPGTVFGTAGCAGAGFDAPMTTVSGELAA
jgi:hypothetical protein